MRLYSLTSASGNNTGTSYGQCYNGSTWQTITSTQYTVGSYEAFGVSTVPITNVYDNSWTTYALVYHSSGWILQNAPMGFDGAKLFEEGIYWILSTQNNSTQTMTINNNGVNSSAEYVLNSAIDLNIPAYYVTCESNLGSTDDSEVATMLIDVNVAQVSALTFLSRTTTGISVVWNNPTYDSTFGGTKIYLDGQLVDTLTTQNTYTFSDLDPSTVYSIAIHSVGVGGVENIQETEGSNKLTKSTKASTVVDCVTNGGKMYNNYCWYVGGLTETCTTVCGSRGGNVGICNEDPGTNAVCQLFYPSGGSGSNSGNAGPQYYTSTASCRVSSIASSCDLLPGYAPSVRFCACNLGSTN